MDNFKTVLDMVEVYDEANDAIIEAVIIRKLGNIIDVKPVDSKHFVKNDMDDARSFLNAWWRLSIKDKSWSPIEKKFDCEKELTTLRLKQLKQIIYSLTW